MTSGCTTCYKPGSQVTCCFQHLIDLILIHMWQVSEVLNISLLRSLAVQSSLLSVDLLFYLIIGGVSCVGRVSSSSCFQEEAFIAWITT